MKTILSVLVLLVLVWLAYRIAQRAEKPKRKMKLKYDAKPKRQPVPRRVAPLVSYAYDGDEDDDYESPLGLVDDPQDEWLEWAIMDDILDGPDEGLF
ncbi:MAG: hypothetical protein GXY36_19305 [Chloroflexi bacterium]|nr:hypothetical protein [Chloroflexota bacterium]